MHGQLGQAGNSIEQANTKGSRINSDVERVLGLAKSIAVARDRVMRHSSALGYFSEIAGAGEKSAQVAPISNNLQSAIADLDRSIDGLHSALNVFD